MYIAEEWNKVLVVVVVTWFLLDHIIWFLFRITNWYAIKIHVESIGARMRQQ